MISFLGLEAEPSPIGSARRKAPNRTARPRPSRESPRIPTPTRTDPARSVRIPGYEVLEELGRGGMGVVYRARQQSLDRIVALKMILAASHASSTATARFLHEAKTIALLETPPRRPGL